MITNPSFLFFRKYLKIILLIGLPAYGIIIFSLFDSFMPLLLNPVAALLQVLLIAPIFYDKSMYQYEWITRPLFNVVSNLLFWIPTAFLIHYAVQKTINQNYKKVISAYIPTISIFAFFFIFVIVNLGTLEEYGQSAESERKSLFCKMDRGDVVAYLLPENGEMNNEICMEKCEKIALRDGIEEYDCIYNTDVNFDE